MSWLRKAIDCHGSFRRNSNYFCKVSMSFAVHQSKFEAELTPLRSEGEHGKNEILSFPQNCLIWRRSVKLFTVPLRCGDDNKFSVSSLESLFSKSEIEHLVMNYIIKWRISHILLLTRGKRRAKDWREDSDVNWADYEISSLSFSKAPFPSLMCHENKK